MAFLQNYSRFYIPGSPTFRMYEGQLFDQNFSQAWGATLPVSQADRIKDFPLISKMHVAPWSPSVYQWSPSTTATYFLPLTGLNASVYRLKCSKAINGAIPKV